MSLSDHFLFCKSDQNHFKVQVTEHNSYLLLIYCCIINHLKSNQVKTIYIYYVTVFVGEESRHGLAGSSASGFLIGCNQGHGWDKVNLKTRLTSSHGSSQAVGLRAFVPLWLLARDHV